MLVPETAMDKNDCLVFWQYNIWLTRQIFKVNTESESHFVENGANNFFWLGVLASNTGHHLTSFLWRKDIHDKIVSNLHIITILYLSHW